jgi:hypothetical protein
MLDTIILEFPINCRQIIDPTKFTPNTRQLETFKGFGKCTNNGLKEIKRKGLYQPKLTAIKRDKVFFLKIEFSAPKVMFGDNLNELEENDFEEMVARLNEMIKNMGVLLQPEQIKKAKVIGLHPSKNILLTNKYTSSFAIRELYKINLSQKMDIQRVSFRNEGEAIQLYSKRHSVVFYDKINDLTKPERRAIDKDQTERQRNLFEFIRANKKGLEVLRFEIRLSQSDKMKEVLAGVGFNQEPVLKNIFKKSLCQKIVKYYWESLFVGDLFLFNTFNNPQRILEMILLKYPKTRIRTAIMLVGLNLLCRDDDGFRGFRKVIDKHKNKTDWHSLRRYLDKFKNDYFKEPKHGFINDIQREIRGFEAFKLDKRG